MQAGKENWVFFFQYSYAILQQKVWLRLKVYSTLPGSGTWFVLGWPWTQRSTCLSLSRLKASTTLPEPKIFMALRSLCQDPGQNLVFQPQDLDHRCDLHFWIVVHSWCSHIYKEGTPSKAEGIFLSVGHSAEESSEMKAERTCRFAESRPVRRDVLGGWGKEDEGHRWSGSLDTSQG